MINACKKNFLDRKPLDQVGASDYFKSPKDLETYVNQFYNAASFPIVSEYGLDFNSDNAVATNFNDVLAGTRTLDDAAPINFGRVRSVNYFFDNYKRIEGNAAFADYKQYVGEAFFFRALIYFELLQGWGDIPWLTAAPGTESPELLKQRDPRNIVADNIIANLDSAALYLQADKADGASRVNKWMALLVQSRVALYEGTGKNIMPVIRLEYPTPSQKNILIKQLKLHQKSWNLVYTIFIQPDCPTQIIMICFHGSEAMQGIPK